MTFNCLSKLVTRFSADRSGETAVQTTIIFSVAVIIGVIVGVPLINDAAKEYAYQKNYGVDPVQTSSVDGTDQPVKRYTVRKSILDGAE